MSEKGNIKSSEVSEREGVIALLKKHPIYKWVLNPFVLVTIVFIGFILFSPANIFRLIGVKQEVSEQESKMKYYKKSVSGYDKKLETLTMNKDSLERFAREKYYFHKEGETVFIVE